MNADPRRHPLMIIPPPLLFALTFLVGRAVHTQLPLRLAPGDGEALRRGAGLALVALGVLCALGSAGLFARARTTLVPHGRARELVTGGTYRLTRNPMYLGLVLVYLGVALRQNVLWPVLLLALPLLVLQRVVIPFEEQRLRELFGEAYAAYCLRVRRWV
jgi:protein-S-isoprenylcysteine O-methyltransferase Ste14